jgi:DNA-binding transcriptional LysR family regulator
LDRLKTMETFLKIVKTGSLAKAAKQLGISPALVSKHLKDMESYLGVRLLNRTTRQMALTDIGVEYSEFCTRILSQIEEEERFILQRQNLPHGSIKIISPMGFGNFKLAPIIAQFTDKYPDIRITLVLSDALPTSAHFIDQGFDLAVRLGDLEDSSIVARKIGDTKWITCASPHYLDRAGRPRIPRDLASHNCLVHHKTAPGSIWYFDSAVGRIEVKVSGTLDTNSVFVVKTAVLAAAGVAIVPLYCIGPELARGEVEEVLSDYPAAKRPVHVLFAYNRYLPFRIRAFVEFLVERLREKD